MTPEMIFRASRILTPDGVVAGSVAVAGGKIVEVAVGDLSAGDSPAVELADEEVLLPGLVDTHVHVNEPGRTDWEGFASATRAAAAGGVTTLLDMPLNSIPPTTSPEALAVKREAARGKCMVDVGFWGGAVPETLGQLRELHEAGVFGFKCFLLDSGVLEFPPLSSEQLKAAMAEIASFDGLLIVHAEDPDVILANACPSTTRYADFVSSRPPLAETRAIETVIDAARSTGCRAHIVHLSSADAVPALAAARQEGVRITVETCPHYLALSAEEVADGATQFKSCPPVRDAANRDRLWQALADGVIDFVVSDHSPSPPELKRPDSGDFAAAWGGISSLQVGLSVVWTEARLRGHSLVDVIGWMSERPAATVGLSGKGQIRLGNDADLVIFAPDEHWVVEPATLQHRHPVSPYADRHLTGSTRATYLQGRRVDLAGDPRGTFLTPLSSTPSGSLL
ncbi:MAG TPA: allantoinase AllB [Propionibacteriaceae bacterium]|nr:allantoinase AllB [Propionibacteriaceae bacterium]